MLLILLAGDIATNPGPSWFISNLNTRIPLKCLLTNARSLKSLHKQGTEITNNIHHFEDVVYSEDSDIVCVNETWLSRDILNSQILDERYEIF